MSSHGEKSRKAKIMKIGTMKNKLTKTKFNSPLGIACHLFSRAACLGAVILICSSASAQNLLVSGSDSRGGEIFKFTWDGGQSIFASGLTDPWDLAFDNAGNLFVVDYDRGGLRGDAAIYKITQNGVRTTFASGLSYPAYLAVDKNGNVFVADYDHGMIYECKPTGSRATFASGLHHPVGMAFNSAGNLFVVDNSAGNIYLGRIYEYKPNGSRGTFTVLDPSDRPADLAFDSMGNLLMADLGGNIYRYDPIGVLRPHRRTTFGSVPNSAQSLAFDSAGNLLVVDAGGVNSTGTVPNAIYKFTPLGARSTFASGQALKEEFSCLAFQPTLPVCCQ
jgi:DNA-binding beta-propeller fold protein YncE